MVRVNKKCSKFFNITSGVSQGPSVFIFLSMTYHFMYRIQFATVQRLAVRWIVRLGPLDSVSNRVKENGVEKLIFRRQDIDIKFLDKIECGFYGLDLSDYITSNLFHMTLRGTVNPHFVWSQPFKFSCCSKMRAVLSFHPVQ